MQDGMVATHAISAENLQKAMVRDAFICPSVMYTKESNALANYDYGNISVVFDEDSINPGGEQNKYNALYEGSKLTRAFAIGDIPGMDGLTNEQLVDEMRNGSNNDYDPMQAIKKQNIPSFYRAGYDVCEAICQPRTYLETCNTDKIIDFNTDRRSLESVFAEQESFYYDFLDKTFPKWDADIYDRKNYRKYEYDTSFSQENGLSGTFEHKFKFMLMKYLQLEDNYKVGLCNKREMINGVKSFGSLIGFRITRGQVEKLADFVDYYRNAPVLYFEAKLMRAVPLSEAKAVVVPKDLARIDKYKDIIPDLKAKGINVVTYTYPEERKQAILDAYKNLDKDINKDVNQPSRLEMPTESFEDKLNSIMSKDDVEKANKNIGMDI